MLKKLHLALLIIADEIERVCKRNDIQYSLLAGSMLGAVRHGGFIPWDDDMDIAMTRSNFKKFLVACKNDLNDDKFEIQTYETDKAYPYGFAKVLLKNTYLVEFGHEKTNYRKGIFVDIFPFDAVPDRYYLKKMHACTITFLKKQLMLMEIKPKAQGFLKNIANSVLLLTCFVINKKSIYKLLIKNLTKYEGKDTKYLSNMLGYYGYMREILPTKMFNSYQYIKFEDREYMVMSDYEKILELYYGDYMKLPPVDKRRTHGFQELNFGPYDTLLCPDSDVAEE